MGHSPCHAGVVTLVLNPTTGHISPQYHNVFGDTFSTVPHIFVQEQFQNTEKYWYIIQQRLQQTKSLEIAKTWFEDVEDPSKVGPMDAPLIFQSSDPPPLANKGSSPTNKGPVPESEEDPTENEGAYSDDPFDLSTAPIAVQKVSDPLQGSEGDTSEMSKNIELCGVRTLAISTFFLTKKLKLIASITGAAVIFA